MGGLIGKSSAVPASPDVMDVPISSNPNFAGPDMQSAPMGKQPRQPSPLMQGIGQGVKNAGDAYDQETEAIQQRRPGVPISVRPPTALNPDLTPNGDYLSRMRRRPNPADQDLFYGG